jgi:hypothetical protein
VLSSSVTGHAKTATCTAITIPVYMRISIRDFPIRVANAAPAAAGLAGLCPIRWNQRGYQGHVMDAKTMLLLGIGMAVLLLLGFCVASRSAPLPEAQRLPAQPEAPPRGRQARLSDRDQEKSLDQLFKTGSQRFCQVAEHPAMLVGLKG